MTVSCKLLNHAYAMLFIFWLTIKVTLLNQFFFFYIFVLVLFKLKLHFLS